MRPSFCPVTVPSLLIFATVVSADFHSVLYVEGLDNTLPDTSNKTEANFAVSPTAIFAESGDNTIDDSGGVVVVPVRSAAV